MSTRVHLVDSDRRHYGFLDGVDESSVLSNLRVQAAKVCMLPANFLFTSRNTPVSLKQEATLKISRCAKVVAEDPKVLEVVIMLTEKVVSAVSSSEQKSCEIEIQQKAEEPSYIHKSKPVSDHEYDKENSHTLRVFTNDEIEDGSISRLEKERRSFWNNLAPKISCHPQYKQWSLQARKGIVDTEWTLRKTELLKVEAKEVMKIVHTEVKKKYNICKTSEKEKKINQNLDCLFKTDFIINRKKTYKNIEDLHKQLKYPGANSRSIEEQITENETALDKLFTELKSTQNALEMTITHVQRNKDAFVATNDKYLEERKVPGLTEEEVNEISQSVMDDFELVEELSD